MTRGGASARDVLTGAAVELGALVSDALGAAAWWALVVLVAGVVAPDVVIPDAAARLRWVLGAGLVCGVFGRVARRVRVRRG